MSNRSPLVVSGPMVVSTEAPAPARHHETDQVSKPEPLYNVVLIDDDDHTYEYVIDMLGVLFGHAFEQAYQMALEVDSAGRVIVDTTHRERAELKRDQIKSFGADPLLPGSQSSMHASIEPLGA